MSKSVVVDDLIVPIDDTLAQALEKMDVHGLGVVFCTESSGRLAGIMTDGDVRRALLAGETSQSKVSRIANRNFIFFNENTPRNEVLAKLSNKIKIIPLVNQAGVPVDFATLFKVKRYPIMEPLLGGNELDYVTECVKTNWISSQGKFVTEFENMFAEYHGASFALAVSNGTVALHLALVSLGIGEGDEVIVPDLTFAASINAILHAGATPVIVDVDPETWNIDPDKITQAITPKTKAIMPVHLYGNPCDMNALSDIAATHGLLIVEDCAEALGSTYDGRKVGVFGDASAFSFFGNKTITTGEGGMILFQDESVYQKAKVLRDHGMSKDKRYWHDYVGYNYRLTNLQAAIGTAQMERIDAIIAHKTKLGSSYLKHLSQVKGIRTQRTLPNATSTFWLFSVAIEEERSEVDAEFIMSEMSLKGIETRRVFYPLSEMDIYKKYVSQKCENAASISNQGVSLPSYLNLELDDVAHISQVLVAASEKSVIRK